MQKKGAGIYSANARFAIYYQVYLQRNVHFSLHIIEEGRGFD